jgi:hypothetical protein
MSMTRAAGTWIAIAMLAIAAGCSDDDDGPAGTCRPTAQTEANPAGVSAFCESLYQTVCHRGFTDCAAELGLTADFASEAECAAAMTSICAYGFSGYWYDAPCGQACIAYAAGAACSAFQGDEPQACSAAIGQLAPPPPPPPTGLPACGATITAGTITDTITASEPVFSGGHARAYCIDLTAGQTITIRTDPPLSGTEISDSVVHLYDATPTQIGYDDDGGTSLYSLLTRTVGTTGQYRIVVRGWSTSDVGSYRLTVTIN